MKCNVCHNEFGNGEYCQNCKADKVVGLGCYTGYNAPHIQHNLPHQSPQQRTTQMVDSNMTICYKCANPIPANVDYCPACGLKLTTMCPKCGNKFSSQYAFCSSCGVNVEEFIAEQKRKEAMEQALRIAEQKRRDAAILAEQQRQAELQRIAEVQKQEELRKRAIAMQQPEFVDALSYFEGMLDKEIRKRKHYEIIGGCLTALSAIFSVCIGWWSIFHFDILSICTDGLAMLFLIFGFPAILMWLCWIFFIRYFYKYTTYRLSDAINKRLVKHPIHDTTVREIVIASIEIMKKKGVYTENKESISSTVLEAYFKLSESSK